MVKHSLTHLPQHKPLIWQSNSPQSVRVQVCIRAFYHLKKEKKGLTHLPQDKPLIQQSCKEHIRQEWSSATFQVQQISDTSNTRVNTYNC